MGGLYPRTMPQLGRLPEDIPACPDQTYADKGWKGMSDWLDIAVVPRLRKFRRFHEARAFARRLMFKSEAEWRLFCKGEMPCKGRLPDDIPRVPGQTYAGKGWKSMGDWLGTGRVAYQLKNYRPFRKARAFAHGLKLKSVAEWRAFCKGKMPRLGRLPADIPAKPDNTYGDQGWKGYADWLGTDTFNASLKTYLPFREARAFVRLLDLGSSNEWLGFCEAGLLPHDIPKNPRRVYAGKGWKSWSNWLRTGRDAVVKWDGG